MPRTDMSVDWQVLEGFATIVFTRAGLPPDDAKLLAKALVWADLRGVESHGVRLISGYVKAVDAGTMNPTPKIRIEKETAATMLIEANRAFGVVVTTLAMQQALKKAKQVGIGWVLIRNHTHQGAMGYYPFTAAQQGMAGLAFVCGSPGSTVPYGAKVGGLSNNPLAIAVPAKRHHPLVLDMAMSVAAGGKTEVFKARGFTLPQGWALDADSTPTTDPALAKFYLPVGGYKGSGLAIMFECLASMMAGNPLVSPESLEKNYVHPGIQNSVVAAIDIGTFTDAETYMEDVDRLIDGLKALPKAEGFDEILMPGERGARVYEERLRNGIRLSQDTVRGLSAIAERFNVEMPPSLPAP